ncbi:winged helix-turn-helix domain-containing protein [Nonomuraea glycinis]|uniref:BTAD domain-containing putative transcriptional regulator n=1 Tax=Nonomuraea glycinis TaxID=2047744 RepID=UPI001CD927F3|nr:BTAD domain-containing putative transcriptional regulator [Nonomuraea glycinis]MCA2178651.1 winged helix-turn-helix domain-containing protein [Nonomuraea glycinis]
MWTDDGRPVRVPEVKVRALLADLLAHEGRPVSADRLAEDLWGDDPPGNPVNTLQTKVSQLRRALEQAEPGGRELVVFQTRGYVLRATDVDAVRFAALLGRARAATDPRAKAGLLSDALALWRGPAYTDFADEEFARSAALRLEEQRLTALEERAEVRLELGEHTLLADELGELVAAHPMRERLRAAHLRALYRSGRQAEALAGYDELRHRLADELGLDPGPELAALHQAMLRQDPSLAPPRPRTNLPAPLTALIGREQDVAEVGTLLGTARLVTLTGPGGVGKTRLALAVAERAADAFPDGVWLVELAGTTGETATVAEVVAAELDVRDDTATGSRPGVRPAALAHRLADALRGRRLLLVLDNCEHVAEPVAELVDLLLRAAPGLRVLTTSQETLALPGETVHAVPPLELPAPGADPARAGSVQLFVARAAAAAPGFVLDEASAPSVAAICRRLDGLPLALELAAARVRALGVRGVADRLDDRFHLLTVSGRGRPARQRTLRAVIDWSWEQLTEQQRLVLLRLAVHPGGCTLEAAAVVCAGHGLDPGADIAVLLDQLMSRSMVEFSGGNRYRLLESIAAYCLERLTPGDAVFQRRDLYYTDMAEQAGRHLRGPAQRPWLERLDAEAPNLRATLAHITDPALASRLVLALAWYWYLRGRHREGHASFTAALALAGTECPVTAAWEAGFAMLTGDGTGLLERSRTAARALNARDARARWFLALAHLSFGDAATAAGLLTEALAGFRAEGDRWGEAAALAGRAKQAMFQGEHALAERSGTQSLTIFGELGDGWGRLQASDMLGYLAEITGGYERAARLHREGLRTAEDLRLWTDVSYRLSSLGRLALLTGDLDGSRDLHERGLRLAAEQSNRFAEEFARVGLGLVARRAADFDTAQRLFEQSLTWNRRLEADYGVPFYGVTLLLAELGFIAEQRGDPATARSLHQEGLAAAHELGDPRAIALAREGLAGVAAAEGAHEEAAALLGEAAALRESVGAPLPPAERGDVDRIAATVRAALGEEGSVR